MKDRKTSKVNKHWRTDESPFNRRTKRRKAAAVQRYALWKRLSKKSTGRMPWHWEPKKDVISCEKLRRAANRP